MVAVNAVLPAVTLVLGGARSGKSGYAETLVLGDGRRPLYLATATPGDDEMEARIQVHRERRGAAWQMIEEPLDLAGALHRNADADAVILVDCLTLWLTNVMMDQRDVGSARDELVAVLPTLDGSVVLVGNEVGLGIVPADPISRAFRDHAGRLHQDIAAIAQSVAFVVAGLPRILKPAS